jgi:DNA-directed RNA polymerase specialized sigma24 family protein
VGDVRGGHAEHPHSRFTSRVERVDPGLVARLRANLAFVAFLPFPTSLVGEHEGNPLSGVVFALALVAVSGTETLVFVHARRAGLLRDPLDRQFRSQSVASLQPCVMLSSRSRSRSCTRRSCSSVGWSSPCCSAPSSDASSRSRRRFADSPSQANFDELVVRTQAQMVYISVVVQAFDDLVNEVRPKLRRALVAAYGLDRGEEAAAEAMAWAWEHRVRLGSMTNPLGYLYRVGQTRSRSRRAHPAMFPTPGDLGLHHVEPALVPALQELSDRQRVCVALVVGHQWTYDEAAELLGISRSSVQSHVDRGLEHLRTRLGVTTDVEP